MRRLISTELHLSVISAETISSDICHLGHTLITLFCQENVGTAI